MGNGTRGILVIGAVTALAACGSSSTTGTSSPAASPAASASSSGGSAAGVLDKAKAYEGTYTGTWKNTTFQSTGAAKLAVRVDSGDGKVEMTITIGGSVFGGTAPGPQLIDGEPTETGALVGEEEFDAFGKTTITIDKDGNITWVSDNVPSQRVKSFTAKGTITPTKISMTSDVVFRDGSSTAHDTIELTQ